MFLKLKIYTYISFKTLSKTASSVQILISQILLLCVSKEIDEPNSQNSFTIEVQFCEVVNFKAALYLFQRYLFLELKSWAKPKWLTLMEIMPTI